MSSSVIQADVALTGQYIQAVQTIVTAPAQIALTAGTYADWTGLTLTITPSNVASKIWILFNCSGCGSATTSQLGLRLMRDATPIQVNTVPLSSQLAATSVGKCIQSVASMVTINGQTLDTPNTTSAVTYKIQIASATATHNLQRSNTHTDSVACGIGVSNIIAIEVL